MPLTSSLSFRKRLIRASNHTVIALRRDGEQSQRTIPLSRGIAPSPDLTGEFDPGSERTLAARLTHASRTRLGATPVEWRTGE